jgi:hypothetical protein
LILTGPRRNRQLRINLLFHLPAEKGKSQMVFKCRDEEVAPPT